MFRPAGADARSLPAPTLDGAERLCATLRGHEMAARALGPTAPSWTRLPGYFAPVSGSWLKKDLVIDGVLRYAGEGWPTNCMDTCFAVKECHGFNIDRDGL